MDLSVSSSSWGLGRAAVSDCGTFWTFLLPFFGILEFYPIVLAVEMWGQNMANHKILFLSDNTCTVSVINKMSSRCPIMMKLIRRIVVATLKFNIVFRSKHVDWKSILVADLISCLNFQAARV